MNNILAYIVAGFGALAVIIAALWRLITGAKRGARTDEQLRAEQAARRQREKSDASDKATDDVSDDSKRDSLRQRARRD